MWVGCPIRGEPVEPPFFHVNQNHVLQRLADPEPGSAADPSVTLAIATLVIASGGTATPGVCDTRHCPGTGIAPTAADQAGAQTTARAR